MKTAKIKHDRTYARNRPRRNLLSVEPDSIYFLKLVVVMLIGMVWLKFGQPVGVIAGIPLGLILGVFAVVKFEPLQTDRKIWYVVLLISAILSFFLPAGFIL